MALHGKKEYRVKPGFEKKVTKWIKKMQDVYQADGFQISYHTGPPEDSGFSWDRSVGGVFETLTAGIHIFHAEKENPAYIAEELAHYIQCKKKGLIGKSESEIGGATIEELEREMITIMESHGFEEIR